MLHFQSDDETGYIEIETEGSVFFRDREGDECYLEWSALNEELQETLHRFAEDAEAAFDEAITALKDITKHADKDDEIEL